jgi:hypothetical protein
MAFSIAVDTQGERFRREVGAGGGVLVDCHLVIDGEPFPSSPWLDFPIVILGWWLRAHRAMRTTGEPAHNDFMNGPFAFTVTPAGEELALALLRDTKAGTDEVGRASVLPVDYEAALRNAASAVLDAVPQQPDDTDVQTLRRELAAV